MERTEADIFAAALDEAHVTADHLGERYPRAQLVEESGRKSHSIRASSCCQPSALACDGRVAIQL
jgi:hypothetical protein